MNQIVSPSLLAADFGHLSDELFRVEKAAMEWIHLDVMDGHFVPNLTFGPPVIASLRKASSLFFDAHLMVSDPLFFLEPMAGAGVDAFTFHYEAVKDPGVVIQSILKKGMRPGIAIKPKTPAHVLYPYLNDLFMVLIMTVEPGFGGQPFMEEMLPKVRDLRRRAPDLHIQVDGGINSKTAPFVRKAGANVLVAGTAVFGAKDYGVAAAALMDQ